MSPVRARIPEDRRVLDRAINEILFAHPKYPDPTLPTVPGFNFLTLFLGQSRPNLLCAPQMAQQLATLHAGLRIKHAGDSRLLTAIDAYDTALAAASPKQIEIVMNAYARRLFIGSRITLNSSNDLIDATRDEYDLQRAELDIAKFEELNDLRPQREFEDGLSYLMAESKADAEAEAQKSSSSRVSELLNELIEALDATDPSRVPVPTTTAPAQTYTIACSRKTSMLFSCVTDGADLEADLVKMEGDIGEAIDRDDLVIVTGLTLTDNENLGESFYCGHALGHLTDTNGRTFEHAVRV